MKKGIILLIAMMAQMLSVVAYADGHLTFRGIDIAGSMKDFTTALEAETGWAKDSALTEAEDEVYYLVSDEDLNYVVEVDGTIITNTVYRVRVHYFMYAPEKEEDKQRGFDTVANMLTQIYGEPTYSANYKRNYEPEFGIVSIELEDLKDKENMVHIRSTFLDKEGDKLFDQERADMDLYDIWGRLNL